MSNITIHCPRCRSTEFNAARKDVQARDRITCAKCGHSDTFENIAGSAAKKYAEDALRKAFKTTKLEIKF